MYSDVSVVCELNCPGHQRSSHCQGLYPGRPEYNHVLCANVNMYVVQIALLETHHPLIPLIEPGANAEDGV